MVERLIINVGVRIKTSGYITDIDKQNHGISADLLASKWGIGVDKAINTLKPTTQDNLR